MRIGVISDTHIPERAETIPEKILEDFKNVDLVLHAGDLIDIKALDLLKSVCKDVRAVAGNMDTPATKSQLAKKEIIEVEQVRIGLTHGQGVPIRMIHTVSEIFKNDHVDIIVFGHTHRAVNEKINNVLFFNPGSATDKIFSLYNSYGILEINGKDIKAQIVKI